MQVSHNKSLSIECFEFQSNNWLTESLTRWRVEMQVIILLLHWRIEYLQSFMLV